MLRRVYAVARVVVSRDIHTKNDILKAKDWLSSFSPDQIPRDRFSISYSRSSGPGGQKVNKTSSKATISLEPYEWLNPKICSWIPKPVLEQVQKSRFRYQTKSQGILIQSDSSRNREVNTDECFRKLLDEMKSVVYFEDEASDEDKRKWEKLAASQKEYRMQEKKRNSEKKKARSRKFDI